MSAQPAGVPPGPPARMLLSSAIIDAMAGIQTFQRARPSGISLAGAGEQQAYLQQGNC